jgi:replicative DNA helicase
MASAPPSDESAEKAVCGAMVIDESVIDVVAGVLTPDDFYYPACRAVYEAAVICKAKGRPVDFQTLQACLGARKQLQLVGGLEGLSEILDHVATAANAEAYAETVREKAVLRRLIIACREIAEGAYGAGESVELFLADAQAKITAATDHTTDRPWEHLGILAEEQLEALKVEDTTPPGLQTGFHELDAKTKGLFPGQLVVVAGRPSMGKTAFVSSMVLQTFYRKERVSTLFVSLEMDKRAVTDRFISMVTGIPVASVIAREVSVDEWPVIDEAKRMLLASPMYIADTPAVNLQAVRAKARRLQASHGIDLLVVDYLQLLRPTAEKDANRERQVASISSGLKELAKEFGIPVIALSQLNRGVEARPNKRPNMADLRESGAIEQDADLIMFIYRDEVYNLTSADAGKAEIIIAKQRNGMVGTVMLDFDGPRVSFRNPGGG